MRQSLVDDMMWQNYNEHSKKAPQTATVDVRGKIVTKSSQFPAYK